MADAASFFHRSGWRPVESEDLIDSEPGRSVGQLVWPVLPNWMLATVLAVASLLASESHKHSQLEQMG